MSESLNRVAVSPSPRAAGTGWVLDAFFPDGKQVAITGFKSQAEANDWLGSARHVAWLRDTRTALCIRAITAAFECLTSRTAGLAAGALELIESAPRGQDAIEAARVAAFRMRAALAHPRAAAIVRAASDAAWRASKSGPRWRTACRFLVTATGALLFLVAVLAIVIAALATFGRSEPPARSSTRAAQVASDRSPVDSRRIAVTEATDPVALLIDRVSFAEAPAELPAEAAAEPPPQPAEGVELADESHVAISRHDPGRAAPVAIVGLWAPEAGACSARNPRGGALRAVISQSGARAGETSCIFRKQRQTEREWRVLATCTNGHDRWKSNVRLTVEGDRLVWTSERGTQAYTRCRSISESQGVQQIQTSS